MKTESVLKIAVIQATPILYDKTEGVQKIDYLTELAAQRGANLVMWPESFIPGYPQNLDIEIGQHITEEEIHKRLQDIYENSFCEADNDLADISEIARKNHIYLALGVTEREGKDLYCSEYLFDPSGQNLGKHRKLRPTGFEKFIWKSGEGSKLSVFHSEYGTIGTAICWENYMPLLRTALYAEGVKIYLAPAADSSEQWQSTLQHIALEGRCFVLCCNHYFPQNHQSVRGREKYRGGSAVISPQGEYLAGPVFDREEILFADLDLALCDSQRYDFDAVYPYTLEEYKNSGI